jgi:hypothetical protein
MNVLPVRAGAGGCHWTGHACDSGAARPAGALASRFARVAAWSVVALAMLAIVGPAPAVGQEQQDTARPFVRGGIYDKPYLVSLLGRASIGGYAEAHARWNHVDGLTEDAGFELRRFNLFASARVSDFVRFAAEVEFEEAGEEVVLELAAVDVLIHPAIALRAGMLLAPLGRFNLAHDSPLNEFTDRPLVSTELLGVALSEPGIGALGSFGLPLGRLTYELYAVNGFHDGLVSDAEGGTRLPMGRRNAEDNNGTPAFVGRLAWSPGLFLELGLSAHHGAYNDFEVDGLSLDDRRDLTIAVIDAELSYRDLRVAGELARADIDIPPGLRPLYAGRQHGLYVDVVYDFGRGWVPTMPRSRFSAVARIDAVDFDADLPGDAERRYQAGINFRPTEETVLKLSYFRGEQLDRFENAAAIAGLRFSVATYF